MEPPWHLIVGVSFWAWIFLLATVLPPPTLLSYNEAFPFQNLPPYLAPVDCTDCNTKSGSCPTQRFLPSYLKLTLRSKGLGMGEGDLKVRINLSIITSPPPNSFLWRQISLRRGNTMEHDTSMEHDRKKMKIQGSRGQSGTGGLQSH